MIELQSFHDRWALTICPLSQCLTRKLSFPSIARGKIFQINKALYRYAILGGSSHFQYAASIESPERGCSSTPGCEKNDTPNFRRVTYSNHQCEDTSEN